MGYLFPCYVINYYNLQNPNKMKNSVIVKPKEAGTIIKPEKLTRAVNRRDLLKVISGTMGFLALAGLNYSCICKKKIKRKPDLIKFWKEAEKIEADELVKSAIKAAKAQVGYSKHFTASKRAIAIKGEEYGKEELEKAKEQFDIRTAELKNTKITLERFVSKIEKNKLQQFNEYIREKSMAPFTKEIKDFTVKRLVGESNILPEEAKKGMDILNTNLDKVAELKSFDEMTQYLSQHIDHLIDKKFGNPGLARGLCILLLVLSSMYLVLIIIAVMVYALICVFTLGYACKTLTLEDVLNDMIDNICGPE
jgi:hypothetical protein